MQPTQQVFRRLLHSLPATYFADWLRSTTVYIGPPSAADLRQPSLACPEAKLAKWNARFQSTYDMRRA